MPMRSLRGDYLANVKLNPQLSVNGFTVSDRRLEREEGDNSEGCVKRGVTPPVLGDLGHPSASSWITTDTAESPAFLRIEPHLPQANELESRWQSARKLRF